MRQKDKKEVEQIHTFRSIILFSEIIETTIYACGDTKKYLDRIERRTIL